MSKKVKAAPKKQPKKVKNPDHKEDFMELLTLAVRPVKAGKANQ